MYEGLVEKRRSEDRDVDDIYNYWQYDSNVYPPEPEFTKDDNKECKDNVRGFQQRAIDGYLAALTKKNKLEDSFQEILDRQGVYEVELIDNLEFLDWTVSDWDESYDGQN